jgi:hypothetical protein
MRGPGEVIRPVVGFIPIVVGDFNESRRVRIRNEGVSDEDRDPLVEFDPVAVEFDAVVGSRARTDSMRLEATAPDDDVKGAARELIDFASRPPSRGAIFVAIAAICVGSTIRRRPTTSESQPMRVTSTGQPAVHLLWK